MAYYYPYGQYERPQYEQLPPPPPPPPVEEEEEPEAPPERQPVEEHWPWFVPGEGIEHRVIQTDLPRYLGNGVVMRRGSRDDVTGYLYQAYRPLTDAMVASLRTDSARYLEERRTSRRRQEREPEYFESRTFRRRPPVATELPTPTPAPDGEDEPRVTPPYGGRGDEHREHDLYQQHPAAAAPPPGRPYYPPNYPITHDYPYTMSRRAPPLDGHTSDPRYVTEYTGQPPYPPHVVPISVPPQPNPPPFFDQERQQWYYPAPPPYDTYGRGH